VNLKKRESLGTLYFCFVTLHQRLSSLVAQWETSFVIKALCNFLDFTKSIPSDQRSGLSLHMHNPKTVLLFGLMFLILLWSLLGMELLHNLLWIGKGLDIDNHDTLSFL